MIYTNYTLVLFLADLSWHLMEMNIGTSVFLLSKPPLRIHSISVPYEGSVFTFLSFIRYYTRRFAQFLRNRMKWNHLQHIYFLGDKVQYECTIHFIIYTFIVYKGACTLYIQKKITKYNLKKYATTNNY